MKSKDQSGSEDISNEERKYCTNMISSLKLISVPDKRGNGDNFLMFLHKTYIFDPS